MIAVYWVGAFITAVLALVGFGIYTMYVKVVLDEEIGLLTDYEWMAWAWLFFWLWVPCVGLLWPVAVIVALFLGVTYPLMLKVRERQAQ